MSNLIPVWTLGLIGEREVIYIYIYAFYGSLPHLRESYKTIKSYVWSNHHYKKIHFHKINANNIYKIIIKLQLLYKILVRITGLIKTKLC